MTCYLLDVNLMLALVDPMHVHHDVTHHWFAATGQPVWATCPIVENGFVRIASHPQYPNRPGESAVVLGLLRQLCAHPGHTFWADDVTLRDLLTPDAAFTHNHLADLYLLGLAVSHGGKLATLDQRIPISTVAGGGKAIDLVVP